MITGDLRPLNVVVGIRQALARLRRFPRLSLAAVLLFALAISGEAALFSLVEGVSAIARPAVPDPSTLVRLRVSRPRHPDGRLSMAHFRQFRNDAQSWGDVAAYTTGPVRITGFDTGLRPATLMVVSWNYFTLLEPRPAAGRFFAESDSVGSEDPIVLADGLWRRVFRGDTSVVGTRLQIGDNRFRVAGIAPPGFPGKHLPHADAWVPYRWDPREEETQPPLWLVGRIRSGQSPVRVSQIATESFRRLANSDVAHIAAAAITEPTEDRKAGSRTAAGFGIGVMVVILAAAGAMVLLRWVQPRREAAMRAALGAGGRPLIAILAWDLGILVLAGAVIGYLFVIATRSSIETLPIADPLRVSAIAPLLGLLAAAAALGGVLLSLWPILRAVDLPPDDPSGLVTLFGTQHAPSPAIDAVPSLALMKSDTHASPDTPERGLSNPSLLGRPRRSFMIASDFRSAYRSLRRSPLFLAVSVLTLGVGIGLTTTMLSMLHAIRNPYVPYHKPEQLFSVTAFGGGGSGAIGPYEKHWALVEGTRSFQGITSATMRLEAPIAVEGREFSGDVISTGPNYFTVMGAPAELGRVLSAGDESNAVIGYGFWRRAFASRPLANGLSLTVNGRTYQVVGVMPREMRTNDVSNKYASVWIPLPVGAQGNPIVRLRDDLPTQAAYAELSTVATRLKAVYGEGKPAFQFRLNALKPEPRVLSDYQRALGGAAIAILLIACANLANLMLVRGLSRRKELSLRLALGAGRPALIRQLLTESAMVGGAGGVAGVVAAVWGIGILRAQFPSQGTWFGFVAPHLSWSVLTIAIGVTVAAVLVFGLAPAILASQVRLNEPLKETSGTTSRRTRRTYALVVVAELALCLALLMGSGILLRAASQAGRFDFGYDTDGLVVSQVGAFTSATSMRQQARQDPVAFQRAVDRIGRMDGVRGVSTYTIEAMGPGVLSSDADAAQQPFFGTGTYHRVGWNFLRTLGVSVIQGRDFEPGDESGAAPVAIVDEAAARTLWPGMDPIGRLVKVSKARASGEWIRIIGVSRHATLTSMLNSIDFLDMVVVFVVQPHSPRNGQIVARVGGDPTVARERMNLVLREELPSNMFTTGFQSWLLQWERQVDGRLTLAGLFAVFGLLAVGLGGIGLYGVLAYGVGQRMREFAVRVALGAVPRDLRRLVLRDAAIMILGGVAAGAFLGMMGASLLDYWLFDIAPTDAISLVSAEAVLLLVAFVACLAPARRAANADPLQIIRAL